MYVELYKNKFKNLIPTSNFKIFISKIVIILSMIIHFIYEVNIKAISLQKLEGGMEECVHST